LDGIGEELILFPYAGDIEYKDEELSFVLHFFDENKSTDIKVTIGLDTELSQKIEELLEMV
jgi:hypothetical protein